MPPDSVLARVLEEGPARNDLRRQGIRTTEEIDVVAAAGRQATLVGECRWSGRPMPRRVLDDLLELKLPALAQAGADVSRVRVALFSRSGFQPDMQAAARERDVPLVDLDRLLADLREPGSASAPG